MTTTTIRSARIDREGPAPQPGPVVERRATRLLGAGAAALIAAVAAGVLAATGGGWFFAIGIPGAGVSGWMIAPRLTSRGSILGQAVTMGGITVAVADLVLIVGSTIQNASSIDSSTSLGGALLGLGTFWLLGMIFVGPFALVIAIPCALAWAAVTRHLLRRGAGVPTTAGR